jgi:hypothetical protein
MWDFTPLVKAAAIMMAGSLVFVETLAFLAGRYL